GCAVGVASFAVARACTIALVRVLANAPVNSALGVRETVPVTIGKQLTGMRGVYLVAPELSRRGFIASPTSRSAIGADILATDQACRRTYSVQVKTNAKTFGFWLLTEKARTTVSRLTSTRS